MLRTWLALLGGIALGAGIMLLLDAPSGGEHDIAVPAVVEKPARAEEPAPSVVAPPSEPSARTPAVAEGIHSTGEAALISTALVQYAREKMRAGWSSDRQDEIPDDVLEEGMKLFEKTVLELPGKIGRNLADRQTKKEQALEDARTGGAFALLAKLREGNAGPVREIASKPEAMKALLRRDTGEKIVDAAGHRGKLKDLLEDGVTLSFPVGVYSVENPFRSSETAPRDVTISGAGMDGTLLVLSDYFSVHGDLRRFALRDCTVFTNGRYLFDQRSGGVTLVMERVRIIGFDMGAGSSCAMSFNSGAVLQAMDCRFEGGYGRNPAYGTVFDVRTDALVARFDRCTFSLLGLRVEWIRPGATVFFVSCSLLDMLDDPLKDPDQHPGISFADSSTSRFDTASMPVPHLDLNLLFPDWQQRMAR